jgi:hypothetical protein
MLYEPKHAHDLSVTDPVAADGGQPKPVNAHAVVRAAGSSRCVARARK